MTKSVFTLLCISIATLAFAQDDSATPQDSLWTNGGTFQFLFNQSAFNAEWQGGGTSNIAGNAGVNYDVNYKNGRTSWDNKLILEFGLTRQEDSEFSRNRNQYVLYLNLSRRGRGVKIGIFISLH